MLKKKTNKVNSFFNNLFSFTNIFNNLKSLCISLGNYITIKLYVFEYLNKFKNLEILNLSGVEPDKSIFFLRLNSLKELRLNDAQI